MYIFQASRPSSILNFDRCSIHRHFLLHKRHFLLQKRLFLLHKRHFLLHKRHFLLDKRHFLLHKTMKKKFRGFTIFFVDFQNFTRIKHFRRQISKTLSIHKPSMGSVVLRAHSRFDVYWLQTIFLQICQLRQLQQICNMFSL